MQNINFHFVRHVPVITPGALWYGEEIEIDLDSKEVKDRFNYLSGSLPWNTGSSLLISSHYPRAQATAKGVLKEKFASVQIRPGFAEQNYGDMKGKLHVDIRGEAHVKAYMADNWNNPPRNGESLKMFQERVVSSLEQVIGELEEGIKDVVIFCHGGVQLAVLAHSKGITMDDLMRQRKQGQKIDISYMSVLKLSYSPDAGKWCDDFTLDAGIGRKPAP